VNCPMLSSCQVPGKQQLSCLSCVPEAERMSLKVRGAGSCVVVVLVVV
jgi:hypothetical protein